MYGIGFGIGLICVFLFFRNRGCNWLPENRVKSSFIERVIVVPEDEMAAYKALSLNEKQLNDLIQNSAISFSESKKKGEPKAYQLTGTLPNGKPIRFILTLPDRSVISELKINATTTEKVKNSITGKGYPVLFPNNKELFDLGTDKNTLKKLNSVGIGKSEQLLKMIKEIGYIDYSKSTFASEKSSHCWVIEKPSSAFSMQTTWYKDKITLQSVELANSEGIPSN
jgi:hypothetical protein